MTKQRLLRSTALGLSIFSGAGLQAAQPAPESKQPNVLLIVMDDMCDWAHYLGGNNQAITPNLDRLAARGVSFANAYAAVPLSNPSRTALLTGMQPYTTGIYNNEHQLTDSPQVEQSIMMPQHFHSNGYTTLWSGKIHHNKPSEAKLTGMWDDMECCDGGYGPWVRNKSEWVENAPTAPKPTQWNEFKPWTGPDTDFPDVVNSQKVVEYLGEKHDKPFFAAMGFYRPHTPLNAPKRYYDLYDINKIELPRTIPDDLNDIPPYAVEHFIKKGGQGRFEAMQKIPGRWREAVRAYLACVSFADDRIGMILGALERSPYADNTYIVLIGDNGMHNGQKERFGKSALWREACHVPLLVVPPKNRTDLAAGKRCDAPVSLIDIYPSLVELCSLPAVENQLAGNSLVPLLRNPRATWEHPSITTFLPGNHTVHYGKWNYIRYADGSQELYDTQKDEDEFRNLANDPAHKTLIPKLAQYLPKTYNTDVPARKDAAPNERRIVRPKEAAGNTAHTFDNPLGKGADPYMIKHDGKYYTCRSAKGGIVITESRYMTRTEQTRVVWKPLPGNWNSHNIWAPELHVINGKWYVYYAAGGEKQGPPYIHQITGVLECDTPLGDYRDIGMVYTGDDKRQKENNVWAIDMTVLEHKGRHYAIWSGWEKAAPDDATPQLLYIAQMKAPNKLGRRVLLSQPEEPWEKGEHFALQEGPQVLKHGDDVFILYSTRGSWTVHYKIGQLRLSLKGNPLDPKAWTKSGPVFQGTPTVHGVGHASFVTSPDDTEYWIYYHSKRDTKPGWDRDVRLQRFTFGPDGNPVFGKPAEVGPMKLPSGEIPQQ